MLNSVMNGEEILSTKRQIQVVLAAINYRKIGCYYFREQLQWHVVFSHNGALVRMSKNILPGEAEDHYWTLDTKCISASGSIATQTLLKYLLMFFEHYPDVTSVLSFLNDVRDEERQGWKHMLTDQQFLDYLQK